MGFTRAKPVHEEGNQMRRSTLSIIGLVAMLFLGLAAPSGMAGDASPANATVSFGAWQTDPPLDRFPNFSEGGSNQHQVIPNQVKIKAGGAVNFINSGLHQVIVYGDGTQSGDIVVNVIESTGPQPPDPAELIDDPTNRIYRGPDPSQYPRDRIEVVYFPNPGTYLVICGVRNHFVEDGMFGFVTVLPEEKEKQ
jgi:plastocyanin